MRQTKRIAIAALVLGALLLPSQAFAEGSPAWRLRMTALPTNLEPGTSGTPSFAPAYELVATNIGAADASGPVTLTATFPAGVTPIFDADSPKGEDRDNSVPDPTCSKAPGQTVTCTAGPVHPGRPTFVTIPVEVSPSLTPGEVLPDVQASVSSPGAIPVATSIPTKIDTEPPPFGFLPGALGFSTLFTEADGSPAFAAGSHPNQLTLNLGFPNERIDVVGGPTTGAGHPRDIVTDLPRGVVVNPGAAATCTELQLLEENCPPASQVGLVTVLTDTLGPRPEFSSVFSMQAPPGSPAMLAFEAAGTSKAGVVVHVTGGVRSDGDFGLYAESADILARDTSPLEDFQFQLWGDPTSASHDQVRDPCLHTPNLNPCGVEKSDTAFITMPSACSGPLTSAAHVRSWEEAAEGVKGLPHEATAQSTDLEGNPIGVSGCSLLEFEPTIDAKPTTNLADSPSGLDFTLHQPQNQTLGQLSTAALKDATVTLPKGLVVNPSQADGLAACSSSQIGLTTAIGSRPIHFTKTPDNCPDAAKIGSLQVSTPLLDHKLPGAIYIAKPFDNPFNSLLAIYLVVDDPQSGTIAKLAGEVISDPITGQLTNRFEENPELPLEDVDLHLFSGARAPLITPQLCGTHTTTSDLTPWSTPEGLNAHPSDSFQVAAGAGGGSCSASEGSAPNNPSFTAGTILPQAGAYTPFVLRLSRNDGSQRLRGIEATLPPGLAARFAGVATCSEGQIAQAISREKPNQGSLEKASPSCPASSAVGTVDVAAGSGPTPFHTQGTAYLAGPYKGAPLSMAIITPAVAGPFDLGAVVVRTASTSTR